MTRDQPDHRETAPRVVRDPVTGRPVFVAPQRGGKPDDRALRPTLGGADDPRGWCPFCAGNESATPPDRARAPADESLPWEARIVPNAFPIAVDRGADDRVAAGVHDVVIESPRHDRSILDLAPEAWRTVWTACHARLTAIAAREGIAWATVFKNSGPAAGASLEHVHSQIVGLDIVPPAIRLELEAVREDGGLFARLVSRARAEGRVVAERGGLVTLVPPAPRQPYEAWIVAVAPQPYFHGATMEAVHALADLTRDLAGRLEHVAPACQYNWWLHQAPFGLADDDAAVRGWHWHVEVLPRLSELAGFEIGTGCHITTVSAEESARRLRAGGPSR
jgi:UDPglucose--hexose-1-phosphate uridylyltransferase